MAAPDTPCIRGAWSRRVLERLPALGDDLAARVRAAVAPELLERIETTPNLGWVPLSSHVAVLEALVATAGEDGARAFLKDASRDNLQGSMLKTAVMSALRAFGVGPLVLLRMFPRGFATITRGCGSVSLGPTPDDDGTEVVFAQLPPEVRVRAFAVSLASVFDAALEVGRRPGDVLVEDDAIDQGRLRYVLRAWDRTGFSGAPGDEP